MIQFRRVSILLAVTLTLSTTAYAGGKIDPLLRIMADKPTPAFGTKVIENVTMADVMVKATDGQADVVEALIEDIGGSVRTIIGDIMTASIPLNAISELDESPFVVAVEAAKPLSIKMNYARTSSGVDQVQAGTCTGCSPGTGGYTGTDVIVGVVDTGVDCQSADFKNTAGTTRIVAYWDQTIAGTGVSEITGSTGKEYTGTALTDGTCAASADTDGHGTHVTGTAAGSNGTYTGVASNASIISVKNNEGDGSSSGSYSTNLIDAVNYIFTKATTLNKAAVVNLSQGTGLGAHDGTSLLEQGLDALLVSGTAEKKGRAIVNAAGNENVMTSDSGYATYGGIHATINVAAGTDKGFEFAVRNSATVVQAGGAILDFWLDSGSSCIVKVDGFNTSGTVLIPMTAISYGAATTTATDNSVTISLNYSETATSGKTHGTATINRSSDSISSSILESYLFHFVLSGTCTGNAWLSPDNTAQIGFTKVNQVAPPLAAYTYVAGDSNSTIVIPATASRVIAVASYMDRASWVDVDGTTHYQTATSGTDYTDCGATGGTDLGLSLFSSLGPTASATDPQKPDIAAPGEPIIATLSSGISSAPATCIKGDASHYKLEGTSMASPHVTGTVALMFQKNNCLTFSNVRTYIRNSATTDSSTGSSLPNYSWGYGKLNAAAVMNLFSADSSCYTTPTPSTSSSSCSLCNTGDMQTRSAWAIVACFFTCGLVMAIRRKRRST